MSNMNNTRETTNLSDLQGSLRLPAEADVSALLDSHHVREAFRMYRNRCLVSGRHGPAQLPDWKDVDCFLYEIELSLPFRRGGRTTVNANPLLDFIARICRDKPFDLMPHVAAFVMRIDDFLQSPRGERFDVVPRGDGSDRESLFDRYSRIMALLRFLVARDL